MVQVQPEARPVVHRPDPVEEPPAAQRAPALYRSSVRSWLQMQTPTCACHAMMRMRALRRMAAGRPHCMRRRVARMESDNDFIKSELALKERDTDL